MKREACVRNSVGFAAVGVLMLLGDGNAKKFFGEATASSVTLQCLWGSGKECKSMENELRK